MRSSRMLPPSEAVGAPFVGAMGTSARNLDEHRWGSSLGARRATIQNEPEITMPELGRRRIHEEGLAVIADWIASMEPTCE